jgi:hypothetical protein
MAAKSKKQKTSWKKVLGICAGILAVLLIVGLFAYTKLGDNGVFGRYTYSVKSENYKVSNNMMTYFLITNYQQYYSNYSYYINQGTTDSTDSSSSSSMPTLSELKEKQCSLSASDPDVSTWYDYFLLEITVPQVKNVLVLAEAANAAGYKLTDEDKASIDEVIESYKTTAQNYGYGSGNEFKMFGAGMKEKDVRAAIELAQLASSYSSSVSEAFTYTESDYDTYLDENKDEFRYVDYLSYTLDGDDLIPEEEEEDADAADADAVDTDAETEADTVADTDAESANETVTDTEEQTEADTEADTDTETETETEAEADADDADADAEKQEYYDTAKTYADAIAAAKSEDEFRGAIESYLRGALYADLKGDELDAKVTEILDGITEQSKVYSDNDLNNKMFEAAADSTVLDDSSAESGAYTVYFITAPDHIEEYVTKNAYVIIVEGKEVTEDTDAEADADAEKTEEADESLETVKKIEEALNSDASVENFAKLAKEYSEGSADGYYKNITKTYFDDEDLNAWLFDDARVAGDRKTFTVAMSESGTNTEHHFIVQYAGDGLVKWQYDADNKLRNKDLTAKSEEFEAAYGGDKITVDKATLYKMG